MERLAVVRALLLLATCSGACPVNSGQCPAIDVIQTHGGNCVNACESDSSCGRDQKCCSSGCGLECMDVQPRAGTEARRGVCPRFEQDTIGVCLDECSPSDDQCEDGKMCCRNGCGHVCATPVVEQTPEKQGKCPAVDDVREGIDTCSVECTDDSDCKSTTKCCSNGCGRVCVNPIKSKKGSCPNLDIIGDKIGDCSTNCTSDEECSGEQLCCSVGCSEMCLDPIEPNPRECPESIEGDPCKENCSSDEDCTGGETCCDTGCGHVCLDLARSKPGRCPQIFKDSLVGICTEDCSSDGDCSGELKCCSNGCGHVCTRPDEQPKPGICPEVPDDTMATCSEECSSDANCSRGQKCCSNGCGHACEEPVWYGCPDIRTDAVGICTDTCESDTDCVVGNQMCCGNGCGHDCITPVLKNKPSPSGQCPAVGETTVGICVDQCHSDADCTDGSQRCCSTGCGHVCTDTVLKTTHNSGCRLGENYYSDGETVSTSEDCNSCICSSGDVVCRIMENCKGKGTFTVSMKTPILCGVGGIIISLLLVAVLVKCYVLRMVSSRRPYKMIYEVQEFEPYPRPML